MSSYASPLPAMIQRPTSNVTPQRPVPAQGQGGPADQQQQLMMLLMALLAGQGGAAAPPAGPPVQAPMLPPGMPQ